MDYLFKNNNFSVVTLPERIALEAPQGSRILFRNNAKTEAATD